MLKLASTTCLFGPNSMTQEVCSHKMNLLRNEYDYSQNKELNYYSSFKQLCIEHILSKKMSLKDLLLSLEHLLFAMGIC